MSDTTTIQLTKAQKSALDDLKRADSESYKSVLQRLIDGYNDTENGHLDEMQVREIAREEITDRVVMEAQE